MNRKGIEWNLTKLIEIFLTILVIVIIFMVSAIFIKNLVPAACELVNKLLDMLLIGKLGVHIC